MVDTMGRIGVSSLWILGRPYICGGVEYRGIRKSNCPHLGVIVPSVHNNSGLALVCWNNDDVGVIPKGANCTALFEGHVGLGWLAFLSTSAMSVLGVC